MSNEKGMVSCAIGCWLVAALGGLLGAVLLGLLGGWTFVQAVFAGLVIAAVAGALLSWIMCRPLPALNEAKVGQATPASAAKPEVAEKAAAPAPSAAAAKADTAAKSDAASVKAPAPKAKPAEKKPAAKPAAEKKPAAKPKAKADPKPVTNPEPVSGGSKPETLSAAREGGPDNLKQIKGVGPKLEALLHSMGFYHFDQIAGWGPNEIAWVDENLEGFKGRVSRDEWVSQAKTLAEGGTTEFSKKVKKGGVY
ncbi:endonuclease [uncultured Tateyamaria sp.]|uniref:endonuclease n=1 Tax=uncultured Tateyamaria sp. TaxID=455651 RepID=UPI00261FC2DF|nr:endonuclease [uncultured Tateyamaria sp.]